MKCICNVTHSLVCAVHSPVFWQKIHPRGKMEDKLTKSSWLKAEHTHSAHIYCKTQCIPAGKHILYAAHIYSLALLFHTQTQMQANTQPDTHTWSSVKGAVKDVQIWKSGSWVNESEETASWGELLTVTVKAVAFTNICVTLQCSGRPTTFYSGVQVIFSLLFGSF